MSIDISMDYLYGYLDHCFEIILEKYKKGFIKNKKDLDFEINDYIKNNKQTIVASYVMTYDDIDKETISNISNNFYGMVVEDFVNYLIEIKE